MKGRKKIVIAGLLLTMLLVSAITWAIQSHNLKTDLKKQEPKKASWAEPVYDKVLLARFVQLGKKYDTLKNNYTISGRITMIDKADTSKQMQNTEFVFCKKGNAMYYKLGATETINEDGVYLYIDHPAKRILLTKQKDISNATPGMQNLTQLAASLKSEYYQMTGSVSSTIQTISLVNEHHISCKQYTISYDTVGYNIKHIYARLTNFRDPLNNNKDKVMDMYLSEWDAKAQLDRYTLPSAIVAKQGDDWKKMRGYEGYELIIR